jgi:hypothetical protein
MGMDMDMDMDMDMGMDMDMDIEPAAASRMHAGSRCQPDGPNLTAPTSTSFLLYAGRLPPTQRHSWPSYSPQPAAKPATAACAAMAVP